MGQADFSGIVQVFDHLKVFLFAVFLDDFLAALRIEKMFQHTFGIGFRVKLHAENFF